MQAAAIERGAVDGIVPLSEPTLPQPLVDSYLERLGVERSAVAVADLAALARLQSAHVDRIAYENVSLYSGPGSTPTPMPVLDPVASATRIVGGRGGYCFILVDAYAALLRSLGFKVSLHVSGVGEDPLPAAKWGNHVVLLAHFDDGSTYVSDVGLGDGPASPFALRAHTWSEGGYTFALEERRAAEWRFVHDATGSFDGFSVSLRTSCASVAELTSYHSFVSGVRLERVIWRREPTESACESRSVSTGTTPARTTAPRASCSNA